jgi:hypothetical protein
MFRREALLIVLIVAHVSTAENNAQEFMHSFVQVLFHHLKITVWITEIISSLGLQMMEISFFFNYRQKREHCTTKISCTASWSRWCMETC